MRRRNAVIIGIAGILLLFVIGFLAYFAYFAPEAVSRREVSKWVHIIGALVVLPTGETPTLATVTNKDKLDDQAFFQQTENGDRMLIYPRAGRAFLYRPSMEKVVGMTEVSIEQE